MSAHDTIEIGRAKHGGWFVSCGPRLLSCHSSAAEMSAWLAAYLAPIDAGQRLDAPDQKPANDSRGFTVLPGGRADD